MEFVGRDLEKNPFNKDAKEQKIVILLCAELRILDRNIRITITIYQL